MGKRGPSPCNPGDTGEGDVCQSHRDAGGRGWCRVQDPSRQQGLACCPGGHWGSRGGCRGGCPEGRAQEVARQDMGRRCQGWVLRGVSATLTLAEPLGQGAGSFRNVSWGPGGAG